jgi:hypothetical protein
VLNFEDTSIKPREDTSLCSKLFLMSSFMLIHRMISLSCNMDDDKNATKSFRKAFLGQFLQVMMRK